MPVLNTAVDVRYGAVPVVRVYLGANLVWARDTTQPADPGYGLTPYGTSPYGSPAPPVGGSGFGTSDFGTSNFGY